METKLCLLCGDDKPIEEFKPRVGRKEGSTQTYCDGCRRDYRRAHYLANKSKYLDKAEVYRKKQNQWFDEYKKTLSCKQCGEARYWVLDFHHRDPTQKDGEVRHILNTLGKKAAMIEVAKCDVLCANCHRDTHYQLKNNLLFA